jgi:hypothetical protein
MLRAANHGGIVIVEAMGDYSGRCTIVSPPNASAPAT